MAGVGVEAADGEGVAQLFDRPGQQRNRFLAESSRMVWSAARDFFVERFGQIQQQHHRDVAPAGLVAHVDARVGACAALEVDQGAQGDVQIEFAAFFLIADAHLFLRLEQVEHALQALGQRVVLGQQFVDVAGIALGVQGFVNAHPVRAEGLAEVVPFRVMARRQALGSSSHSTLR